MESGKNHNIILIDNFLPKNELKYWQNICRGKNIENFDASHTNLYLQLLKLVGKPLYRCDVTVRKPNEISSPHLDRGYYSAVFYPYSNGEFTIFEDDGKTISKEIPLVENRIMLFDCSKYLHTQTTPKEKERWAVVFRFHLTDNVK